MALELITNSCISDLFGLNTFSLVPGVQIVGRTRKIDQPSVVQTLVSAFHWLNHYPVDNTIGFRNTYPLDNDLSGG